MHATCMLHPETKFSNRKCLQLTNFDASIRAPGFYSKQRPTCVLHDLRHLLVIVCGRPPASDFDKFSLPEVQAGAEIRIAFAASSCAPPSWKGFYAFLYIIIPGGVDGLALVGG